MRKGLSDIEKRQPKPKQKEVRLKIKKATAENILKMNEHVATKQQELNAAVAQMQNHVLPLLTEAGLEKGNVVQVTAKEPYELVIMVPE